MKKNQAVDCDWWAEEWAQIAVLYGQNKKPVYCMVHVVTRLWLMDACAGE